MEAHAWELLCGLAFKHTTKITAPHMLALRQIAWLNLTGSQSAALHLITVSSALKKKKKKIPPTCYISRAQKRETERQSSAVTVPEQAMKDEVQGLWMGRKGQSSFVSLTRHSAPTCLPSLPPRRLRLKDSLLKETQQITPIHEQLTSKKGFFWTVTCL